RPLHAKSGLMTPTGPERLSQSSTLVADILQEQARWNLVAEPGFPRELVHFAADGVELRTLQVAALRPGDLVARGSSLRGIVHHPRQRHPLVRQRDAIGALVAFPSVGVFPLVWPRLPADELIVEHQIGHADRRRRIAETQIHVDAVHAL